MNLVPTRQLLLKVPFQSTKYRKYCVWTTKYMRLLEMCIAQHVEMRSVFAFQPKKRLVSTIGKKAKPAADFYTPFKDQKPTIFFVWR